MNNQLIKPMDFLNEAMPECNEEYPWTDLGDGKIFAHCYQNIVRYVPERESWYIYEDGIWKQDLGGLQTMEYCKIMACALQKYQESIHPYRLRVDYGNHCRVWQRRSKRETVLKEAKGIMKTSIKNFDSDPFVLNCLNGTLNLHTIKFSPHNSADLLTKMAEVRYEPDVRCERFEQFVTEIMSGDLEKARYLQKVKGYTLSGNTREECMFFLWGETTRNGKGTLCETILKLMGSYGIGANPEVLAEPIDHFVQENLIATPNGEVRTAQVYGCYRIWCEDNGLLPESSKVFNAQLRMIATVTRKRPRSGGAMTTLLLGYQLVHKDNTPA